MNSIKGLKLRGNCVGPGIQQDGWRISFGTEVQLPSKKYSSGLIDFMRIN